MKNKRAESPGHAERTDEERAGGANTSVIPSDSGALVARKTCLSCGEDKPRTHEFYHRMAAAKDGFRPRCKECSRSADAQRARGYRKANKPSITDAQRNRYNTDPVYRAKAQRRARDNYRAKALTVSPQGSKDRSREP